MTVVALASCQNPAPPDNGNMVKARLYGEGEIGDACVAQSQCGYRQRCVGRASEVMTKPLEITKGVCEADIYPGGCFALLPASPMSEAVRNKAQGGRSGLPVTVICH